MNASRMQQRAPSAGITQSKCSHSCRRNVAAAAKTDSGPRLAIAGITGAVGQEFLRVRYHSSGMLISILISEK